MSFETSPGHSDSWIARHRPQILASASLATGLLLFLSFFLPWFRGSLGCQQTSCTGSLSTDPVWASGFVLAGPGVHWQVEVCQAGYQGSTCYPASSKELLFVRDESFSDPLLWGLLAASVALIVLPLLLLRNAEIARRSELWLRISVIVALLIELIYLLFSLFFAFPSLREGVNYQGRSQLFPVDILATMATSPAVGFWVSLVATLALGGLLLFFHLQRGKSRGAQHNQVAAQVNASGGISRRSVLTGLVAVGGMAIEGSFAWWVLASRSLFSLTYHGHTAAVNALAWSPDGQRLVTGSSDKTVQVWEATTGRTSLIYRGHGHPVSSVAWSPDGRYIVSCSGFEPEAQVWEAASGKRVFTYRSADPHEYVLSVAWSPDGQRIASGLSGTIQTWNALDGGNVLTYAVSRDQILHVAWSPDGRYLASLDGSAAVQVWKALDGNHVYTYQASGVVSSVAWSPDGQRLVSVSSETNAEVWDAFDGGHLFIYDAAASVASWSPDGQRIATGGLWIVPVQVWKAAPREHPAQILFYHGFQENVQALTWSPDCKRLAWGEEGGVARIWTPEEQE